MRMRDQTMQINNMLHYTEYHRFCVRRDFALGPMDYRVFVSMYQPMIGAFAAAVYMALNQQLPSEKIGYSPLEQQRKLFLALDLDRSESGRKYLIEQTSKLEAVGLLQTSRRFVQASEDYVYEYHLQAPLGPSEFFRNQHLTLLLRDKIGKYAVLALKEELLVDEPDELLMASAENLSVPFYDIFRLNTQVIDYELEQTIYNKPVASDGEKLDTVSKGFDYADIITRFPRGSRNRPFVEQLKYRQDQLVTVNLMAKKYDLTLQETCRLLDEDGVFDGDGGLLTDVLQHRASLLFRQTKRRESQLERVVASKTESYQEQAASSLPEEKVVEMAFYLEVPPLFQGQCDDHQYNMMLRNEPYTKVLQRFFPQAKVPDGVLDIFEKVDLTYKVSAEVINVMIHFIHAERRSWSKTSIEQLASDLLGKHISRYEQAVDYVREKRKQKLEITQRIAGGGNAGSAGQARGGRGSMGGSSGKASTGTSQKPKLPVASSKSNVEPPTPEELDHIRKLARKLQDG